MASKLKNDAERKDTKTKTKFRLPLSALLSYLCIATLILSGISLAKYTTASSDSLSARTASFSVSAEMKDAQNNEITLTDGGICNFEVTNSSEVSVTYHVIIKGVPAGVDVSLTAGQEVIQMLSYDEDQLISAEKLLKSGTADECTLAFTAYEKAPGTHDISVQVRFEQTE